MPAPGLNTATSLMQSGAVGDILYNFVDMMGAVIDHPVNHRAVSIELDRLARIPEKVFVSSGREKVAVMNAALRTLRPMALITNEHITRQLLQP